MLVLILYPFEDAAPRLDEPYFGHSYHWTPLLPIRGEWLSAEILQSFRLSVSDESWDPGSQMRPAALPSHLLR